MNVASGYVGRFAPSPSGPMHFGSLLAAVASYLQARTAGGRWLVRIEDIDPPRQQPGADTLILRALEAYGFAWDTPAHYQSHQRERHLHAVDALLRQGDAYRCTCSRRDLQAAPVGALGPIYPGNCREGCGRGDYAVRVRTHDRPIEFRDALQGRYAQRLESESGDFIVLRRDGLIAYHLAVVADDARDGITEIVRGIDLLDSTPRQIHLQRLLGLATPAYLHIPVVQNAAGQKLSKRTGAPALDIERPQPALIAALRALSVAVPDALVSEAVGTIWQFAMDHWRTAPLRNCTRINHRLAPLAEPQNGLS